VPGTVLVHVLGWIGKFHVCSHLFVLSTDAQEA
jgi:hypothetical protein